MADYDEDSNPIGPPPTMEDTTNDDDLLAYTLGIRKNIVEKIYADNNGAAPTESKMVATVDSMLRGIESIAMGRKKIASEEKSTQAAEAMQAALVDATLRRATDFRNLYEFAPGTVKTIPTLPEGLERPAFVNGEMADLPSQETCDDFQRRMAE